MINDCNLEPLLHSTDSSLRLLCLPILRDDGTVEGILQLLNKTDGSEFVEEDVSALLATIERFQTTLLTKSAAAISSTNFEESLSRNSPSLDVPFSVKVTCANNVPLDQISRGVCCVIAIYHGSSLLCPIMRTPLVQPRRFRLAETSGCCAPFVLHTKPTYTGD